SASLRADSTCGEFECRAIKLDFLARYTALYANKVIVPVRLSSPDTERKLPSTARYDLQHAIQTLLQLRPLINAGLVEPAVMRSPHCKHTIEWVRDMNQVVYEVAEDLAKDVSREFEVTYQLPGKAPSGRSTVYVEGPEDLLEHGNMVW